MERADIVIAVLVIYQLVLLGIGFWASRRTTDGKDFFLAGRQLGPVVAAISYASSASSAWTLLGLSGIAYAAGVSAIWVAAGSISGMFVAWWWIAPRLMQYSRTHDHLTLTDFLAHGAEGSARRAIVYLSSGVIIFSFVFYVAAQFQGAGNMFSSTFDMSLPASIAIGALVIMIYTFLGGFWAVSLTDTLQGILMAITALLLPVAAMIAVGGLAGLAEGLHAVSSLEQVSFTAGGGFWFAAGVIIGGLAIGIGTYGQPHLLVRFMALRDTRALLQARWIVACWYLVVFLGMILLGLAGRILFPELGDPENIFFNMNEELLPPIIGAVLLAAVLSAIMSTADSQLLVAAGVIAHDLGLGHLGRASLLRVSRLVIVLLVAAAVAVALYLPESIFNRVLFAWIALGSAFGPIVFLRLAGYEAAPASIVLSIFTGFSLSVLFYLMPDTPGEILERLAPFCCAFAVLMASTRRRRVADSAADAVNTVQPPSAACRRSGCA